MKLIRGAALASLAVIAGCTSQHDYGYVYDHWRSSSPGYSYTYEASPTQPELGLSDDHVQQQLTRSAVASESRRAELATRLEGPQPETVYEVAAQVDACFREGQRDLGLELVQRYEQVQTWDEARDLTVACNYRAANGGVIELTMTRADASQPLAVAFPPGTYGQPVVGEVPVEAESFQAELGELDPDWTQPELDRRYRHWPSAQDLAFLRAPVVTFDVGQTEARLELPVACAAFQAGPPQVDQPYTLAAFPQGSEIDRLMVALCANPDAGQAETQLAVWLVRNQVTWEQFCAQGGDWGRLVTFGRNLPVTGANASGAARLMLEGGIDPRGMPFFADQTPGAVAPAQTDAPQADVPQAEEQPALDPAELETGPLS